MVHDTTREAAKPYNIKRFSRPILIIAGIAIILLLCWLVVQFGFLRDEQTLRDKQAKWNQLRIDNYVIIVDAYKISPEGESRITVQNGHVISVDSTCKSCSLDEFQQFTIDALFTEAISCKNCSVETDPTYSYPSLITWTGPIADSNFSVRVVDFQPELKANR